MVLASRCQGKLGKREERDPVCIVGEKAGNTLTRENIVRFEKLIHEKRTPTMILLLSSSSVAEALADTLTSGLTWEIFLLVPAAPLPVPVAALPDESDDAGVDRSVAAVGVVVDSSVLASSVFDFLCFLDPLPVPPAVTVPELVVEDGCFVAFAGASGAGGVDAVADED